MPHITLEPDTCVSNIEFEIGEYSPMFLTDLPDYTGETTVTPSMKAQTLETANKAMHDNVVVEAIPYDEVEAATPVIAVNANGKVTATTNQQGGIVEQTTKQAEYQQTVVDRAKPSVTVDNAGKITATTNQQGGFVQAGTETTELQQETVIQATPSISVASDGTITATATQTAGFVAAGTKTATQSQETVEQATPSISVNSTGKITATASQVAGFVAQGTKTAELQQQAVEQAAPVISVANDGTVTAQATQTAGFVNAGAKSAAYSLPTQAAKTVTPTESTQTAVASGKWTTGAVQVGAIPPDYIKPSGTLNITENGTYDISSYANVEVKVRATVAMLNYYSWDGETLLFSEEIENGSDGTYSGQPTRTSTAQYSYTFLGWALTTDAQAADVNATKAVTTDRDVYAAYSRTVRTYTVRFLNGSTVLQTVNNVPYGGSATYSGSTPVDPSGEGKDFNGWNPAPTNIQGNTDCVAKYKPTVEVVEITDSWDTIITNANAGNVDAYPVGAYKPLDLGTEGTINMQIVGKGVDPKADGSGNAALTFVAKNLLATTHRMNPEYSAGTEGTGTLGGWEKSEMRTYLNETILPLVPSNVAAAIKPVTKYTRIFDASETAVDNVATTDKLWIPSSREVATNTSQESSSPSYSALFKDNASRKKYMPGDSYGSNWWLRSADSVSIFRDIKSSGAGASSFAQNMFAVALGFCI